MPTRKTTYRISTFLIHKMNPERREATRYPLYASSPILQLSYIAQKHNSCTWTCALSAVVYALHGLIVWGTEQASMQYGCPSRHPTMPKHQRQKLTSVPEVKLTAVNTLSTNIFILRSDSRHARAASGCQIIHRSRTQRCAWRQTW